MEIDVALLPSEPLEADAIAVVDVLRATTTQAALLAAGALSVTAVATVEGARALAARERALLFGEVHGRAPEGFDGGNSPSEAEPALVGGRHVVHFTTNGTSALCAARGSALTVAACAGNAAAVAATLAAHERIGIVCAGEAGGTRFGLEDLATAGEIVRELMAIDRDAKLKDGAVLARGVPLEAAFASHHAALLRQIGLGSDVDLCLRRGWLAVVPAIVDRGEGWARLEALP